MTQTAKTLMFVVVAAASVAVAAGTYYSNKPADIADFNDVGDKFYPSFEDPNEATGLRVAAYDEATGKTEVFKVENKNGLWRIPSHHDYPADGKDRLSKTAASMIGTVREALAERSRTAQKRLDVLDPLNTEISGTDGRGQRITLFKGDAVLVDFIIGKKVDESGNRYFIRRADEDRTYMADLGNFQVSTKFADWIEKGILDFHQPEAVREVLISRYYVDETKGKVVQQGKIDITRPNASDPWAMTDLKPETEKVKTSEVDKMIRTLTELQIVGVRRKPESLIAGLKSKEGAISIDPFIQQDLQEKGVFISGQGVFVYNEGKVNVGTEDGVLYELGFGEEFAGSDIDIEIGKKISPEEEAKRLEKATAAQSEDKAADKPEEKATEDKAEKAAAEEKAEKAIENDSPEQDSKKKSRYLFVTVFFDKSLMGPAPVAPTKPEAPAEPPQEETAAKPEDAAEKKADDAAVEPKSNDAAGAKDNVEGKDKKEEPAPEKPAVDPKEKAKKAYEAALKDYELQQEVYEIKKKDFEEKIKAGEKRAQDLNVRFADWYYVISEDVFDQLKLKREDLVEPVEQPKPEEKTEAEAAAPGSPEAPGKKEAMPAEKPQAEAAPEKTPEKPATEKPAADKPEAAEKPAKVEKAGKAGPPAELDAAGKADTPPAEETKPSPPPTTPAGGE